MAVNTYRSTVPTSGEGASPNALATRRAEQVFIPAFAQWGLEGRLLVANRGTMTTPIVSGHVAIDEDQPEFVVRVPTGTTILPLYLETVIETILTASVVQEIMYACAGNDIGNGTSTNVVPINLATSGGKATNCVVQREYTANSTAPTSTREFARWGMTTGATAGDNNAGGVRNFPWAAGEMGFAPVLVGPASLMLYAASATTSITCFMTVVWAEFLSSELGY